MIEGTEWWSGGCWIVGLLDCWIVGRLRDWKNGLLECSAEPWYQRWAGGESLLTPTLSLRESEKKAWFVVHVSVCRSVPER